MTVYSGKLCPSYCAVIAPSMSVCETVVTVAASAKLELYQSIIHIEHMHLNYNYNIICMTWCIYEAFSLPFYMIK